MSYHHDKNLIITIFLLMSFNALNGCGKYRTIETIKSKEELQVNNDSMGELANKRHTSIQKLELISRLPSPTVGLVQYRHVEAPVVLPASVPDPALLFQIYRCPAHVRIQGLVNEFDDSTGRASTASQFKEFYTLNRFWEDIKFKCDSVAEAHPQIEFVDLTAPSGDWRWYIRACLPNLETKSFLCSDVVTASAPLLGFQNMIDEQRRELLVRITNRISAIRQIAASLPVKATALAEAYDRCNTADWEKTKRLLKRSLLANIIGYGSAILIDILAPNSTRQNSSHKSITDRIKAIWETNPEQVQTGQSITRILLWLFTGKDDFKETCSAAEEIKINTVTELFKIKDLQLLLAADAEEAQRVGLDIPEGLLP